jgi:GNAT superfamily N-acetyltransferase
MLRPLLIQSPRDLESFCSLAGLTALSPDVVARQHPDTSWLLLDGADRPVARCSLWWTQTPRHEGQRLGLIGHYAADTEAAAAALLAHAGAELKSHGCTLAVGPMDGNTWQRYRLLTERGTEPVFFLEPDNPDDWPAHFTTNGFHVLAHYFSALCTNLERQDPRLIDAAARLEHDGVSFRTLRLQRFEDELRSIHALSLLSFRNNFLYTPIDEDDFVAQYYGVRDLVRPGLVLIAEKQGQPIGYVFGLPDLLQARRGQAIDTVIVKTLAVHPDHGGGGLGGLLTARCHEAARQIGFTRAIHALMHETNRSRRISGHTAHTIRRYALYARSLEGMT